MELDNSYNSLSLDPELSELLIDESGIPDCEVRVRKRRRIKNDPDRMPPLEKIPEEGESSENDETTDEEHEKISDDSFTCNDGQWGHGFDDIPLSFSEDGQSHHTDEIGGRCTHELVAAEHESETVATQIRVVFTLDIVNVSDVWDAFKLAKRYEITGLVFELCTRIMSMDYNVSDMIDMVKKAHEYGVNAQSIKSAALTRLAKHALDAKKRGLEQTFLNFENNEIWNEYLSKMMTVVDESTKSMNLPKR